MKYTEEVLTEAVRHSTSMVEVMRFLGVKPSGGAHAHLRRRINHFEIDTGHFRRAPHNKGKPSLTRLKPEEILVRLPEGSGRARTRNLRRALVESDVPYACVACGLDGTWQGRPITLHVDHINGDCLDCLVENVRFLCPNCHSQTWNFAGRGKARAAQPLLSPVPESRTRVQLTADDQILELFDLVDRGILTVTRTVELIGCARSHYYRLRRRLTETGSIRKSPSYRAPRRAVFFARDRAVIEYSLAHPEVGQTKLASALRGFGRPEWKLSDNTVARVLKGVGIPTRNERRQAADARIWSSSHGLAAWAKPTLAVFHSKLLVHHEAVGAPSMMASPD